MGAPSHVDVPGDVGGHGGAPRVAHGVRPPHSLLRIRPSGRRPLAQQQHHHHQRRHRAPRYSRLPRRDARRREGWGRGPDGLVTHHPRVGAHSRAQRRMLALLSPPPGCQKVRSQKKSSFWRFGAGRGSAPSDINWRGARPPRNRKGTSWPEVSWQSSTVPCFWEFKKHRKRIINHNPWRLPAAGQQRQARRLRLHAERTPRAAPGPAFVWEGTLNALPLKHHPSNLLFFKTWPRRCRQPQPHRP